MDRTLLLIGAISGFTTVLFGAFGAHGLEGKVAAANMVWWDKAVNYQGLHTLAILVTGLLALYQPSRLLSITGWLFCMGILLFSGSLYTMTLTDIRALGMLTPFGGTSFLAGWFCLAMAAWRLSR